MTYVAFVWASLKTIKPWGRLHISISNKKKVNFSDSLGPLPASQPAAARATLRPAGPNFLVLHAHMLQLHIPA